MTIKSAKSGFIWMNLGNHGLFTLHITNLNSKFRNSKLDHFFSFDYYYIIPCKVLLLDFSPCKVS